MSNLRQRSETLDLPQLRAPIVHRRYFRVRPTGVAISQGSLRVQACGIASEAGVASRFHTPTRTFSSSTLWYNIVLVTVLDMHRALSALEFGSAVIVQLNTLH